MRLLTAVHPTDNQKRVLALIANAATPSVAAQSISTDANLVAARNMLMKLGAITFSNGEAEMTDRGTKVATDENIIDQSGQLTPAGQQLVGSDTQGQPKKDQETPPADGEGMGDVGNAGMDDNMGVTPPEDPSQQGQPPENDVEDDFKLEGATYSSLFKQLLG